MTTDRTESLIASAESAELYRDVVAMTIHDLGAISMALSLRAEVLASVLPGTDHAAFMSLSGELAEMRSTLRLALGPRGSNQLSPERSLAGEQWWRVASRLSTSSLPRGIHVECSNAVTQITSRQASALTHLWMAACKGLPLKDRIPGERFAATVQLSISPRRVHSTEGAGDGAALIATLPVAESQDNHNEASNSRWFRYSKRVARRNKATLDWWSRAGSVLEWKCEIG